MITKISAQVRLAKYIDPEGTTHSSKPFKTFTSTVHEVDTAEEFEAFLDSLAENQTIIYGKLKNPTGPRSLNNIESIHNPWIAFDGDYIIDNPDLIDNDGNQVGPITLSIDLLTKLDPQLANCRYVERNSSSNIIIDGQPKNSHKKKIWFQFHTSSQDEITAYIDTLFKRAITMHYGQMFISESENSFATYLRTIFDKVVFSPERIWNEAAPKIDATNIKHNTSSTWTEGNMVEPLALHPITDQEESVYIQMIANHKHNIQPLIQERKDFIKSNNSKLYHRLTEAESHILSSLITTSDNDDIEVVDILNSYIDENVKHDDLAFRDPLDPDYGSNKAKLFYNEDGSIKLHSFAHGSHTYHLMLPVKRFFDFNITSRLPEGKKVSRQEKFKALDTIRKIIPYIYIDDLSSLEMVIDELKNIGSKPSMKKLFDHALTKKSILLRDNNHMERYSLYRKKSAPWVSFDKEEGLVFISREGMAAVMDNKEPGIAGIDVMQDYLNDPKRKEVDGFGMYVTPPTGKLNMWAGFNAHKLPQDVTEKDIAPYMELVDLIASTPAEKKAFLDWRADLLQRPLRKGGRPGYAVKGDKGTGKSFEQELMADMFHPFNVQRVNSIDQIIGKHNAEHAHTVLIIAEEMSMGHTSYAGVRDRMKAILTAPTIRVEPKGIDSLMVPNHIHIMLSTNHAEAVLQDSDDRRWTIFQIDPKRKSDKKFFAALQDWWDHGGKNLVFTYLINREYELTDVTEGILTSAGKEERIYGFYGIDAWVFYLLTHMKEDLKVSTTQLHLDYSEWFQNMHIGKTAPTIKKFGLDLNKQGIIEKHRNDRILRLKEGRKLFEKKFFDGKEHDWTTWKESESNEDNLGDLNVPAIN